MQGWYDALSCTQQMKQTLPITLAALLWHPLRCCASGWAAPGKYTIACVSSTISETTSSALNFRDTRSPPGEVRGMSKRPRRLKEGDEFVLFQHFRLIRTLGRGNFAYV